MDLRFLIGIIGSLILVIGAWLPDRPTTHPARSPKNILFAGGSACMFAYALLGYLGGGPIFFVILQIFIAISTVSMLCNIPDRYDSPLLGIAGIGLVCWSLSLFEGVGTAVFVVGLSILGIGFALEGGTVKREATLAIGSAVIAFFSFIARDWIFVGLNVVFAALSGWQVWVMTGKRGVRMP